MSLTAVIIPLFLLSHITISPANAFGTTQPLQSFHPSIDVRLIKQSNFLPHSRSTSSASSLSLAGAVTLSTSLRRDYLSSTRKIGSNGGSSLSSLFYRVRPGRTNDNARSRVRLFSYSDDNTSSSSSSYDISKPTFDILTLRSIRADAIVRYDALNQSEPLRINLYALITLSCFAFPTVSEAVLGEHTQLTGTISSIMGGCASMALFVRECARRSKQLDRIEKEMNAEFLSVRLPSNKFAERPFVTTESTTLKALRTGLSGTRVLAVRGNAKQLYDALLTCRIFRNRLCQARVVVVPVPTDGSTLLDWGFNQAGQEGRGWLAEAMNVQEWLTYFRSLCYTAGDDKDVKDDGIGQENRLAWFGLNNNGRSFGSGVGDPPRLIELLGQNLRPVELLDRDDAAEGEVGGGSLSNADDVLIAQRRFYAALTGGDLEAMRDICNDSQAGEVTEVVDGGGRIDNWESCLAEGAKPSGMTISGSDVLVVSETEAYSTTIEFPPDAGIDSATLLAVQQWVRDSSTEEWKLKLHQTIPWNADSKAGGTLRCDCRGCVALTRGPERRTFGGLIG